MAGSTGAAVLHLAPVAIGGWSMANRVAGALDRTPP